LIEHVSAFLLNQENEFAYRRNIESLKTKAAYQRRVHMPQRPMCGE
jgi:hypothetical protein